MLAKKHKGSKLGFYVFDHKLVMVGHGGHILVGFVIFVECNKTEPNSAMFGFFKQFGKFCKHATI